MDKVHLLVKEAKLGCGKSRSELMVQFEPLIHNVLKRFKPELATLEVLKDAGRKGLKNAIDEYDFSKDISFDVFVKHVVAKKIQTELHRNMSISSSLKREK